LVTCQILPAGLEFFNQLAILAIDLLALGLSAVVPGFFVMLNQQHVFHIFGPPLISRMASAEIDRAG
jgi:hypothetical protein